MKSAESFDIQEYMTKGVERIVSEALKATLKNPKERAIIRVGIRFPSAFPSISN